MKKITIRWKFLFSSFGVMLTTVIIVSLVITFSLKRDLENEVADFRQLEESQERENLKNYVDIAYKLLDEAALAADQGTLSSENAKKQAFSQIEKLRYDSGTGYFWINDMGDPVPRMIMHPTVPALNGKVLDDPKFNCALGEKKNLFVAMVEACSSGGEGFVDYLWPKPTKDGLTTEQPKLSYVKLHEPFGWVIGTGKYIDDIDAAVAVKKQQADEMISGLIYKISFISIAVLVLAFIPLLFAAKRIVSPIVECIEFASEVEKGNLAGFIKVKRNDETGMLAGALNNMVNTMRQILSDVYQHSTLVVLSSNKLAGTSSQMSDTSSQISEQTNSVAVAAEQASTNINSVSETVVSLAERANNIAAHSNEMSDNVNSVASAVEQMSQSIHGMAKHCADAQTTAGRNLNMSDQASSKVHELNEAAQNIGQVISLIDKITEQTKLLALNATIESARAGEAGKGFSIVANEVKELAEQTASATETISASIQGMQDKTKSVVDMIQDMTIQNQELNEINTSIAASVEEQSATTVDIARTVAETAQGAVRAAQNVQEMADVLREEISTNSREASAGVSDVSLNIQQVNAGIKENAYAAVGNVAFSEQLAAIASELRESFSRFDLGYRKFDIGMIKAAHLAWKIHLEAMLKKGTSISKDEIPDHTQCDFGKWLVTPEAQGLKSLDAYPEMIEHHEKIHSLAYKITEYYHNGEQNRANILMEEFTQTSKDLFASLDKLYTS